MPISRSRVVPTGGTKPSGRRSPVDSPQTSRVAAPPRSGTSPRGPEWTTKHWKLQVEAEARNRLKQSIRHVGS